MIESSILPRVQRSSTLSEHAGSPCWPYPQQRDLIFLRLCDALSDRGSLTVLSACCPSVVQMNRKKRAQDEYQRTLQLQIAQRQKAKEVRIE